MHQMEIYRRNLVHSARICAFKGEMLTKTFEGLECNRSG